MAHKVTTIVAETKENLQFFDIGGRSPLLNGVSLGLTVPLEIIYPNYSNLLRPNLYLVGFAKRE